MEVSVLTLASLLCRQAIMEEHHTGGFYGITNKEDKNPRL